MKLVMAYAVLHFCISHNAYSVEHGHIATCSMLHFDFRIWCFVLKVERSVQLFHVVQPAAVHKAV